MTVRIIHENKEMVIEALTWIAGLNEENGYAVKRNIKNEDRLRVLNDAIIEITDSEAILSFAPVSSSKTIILDKEILFELASEIGVATLEDFLVFI